MSEESKYEYNVTLWAARDYPKESFETWLDMYGQQGWMLVATTPGALSTECIFMREREAENES